MNIWSSYNLFFSPSESCNAHAIAMTFNCGNESYLAVQGLHYNEAPLPVAQHGIVSVKTAKIMLCIQLNPLCNGFMIQCAHDWTNTGLVLDRDTSVPTSCQAAWPRLCCVHFSIEIEDTWNVIRPATSASHSLLILHYLRKPFQGFCSANPLNTSLSIRPRPVSVALTSPVQIICYWFSEAVF